MDQIKIDTGTIVKIYRETPTFTDGLLAVVLDRNPIDNTYLVADLKKAYKYELDMNILLNQESKWVDPQNFEIVNFNRPKKNNSTFYIVILNIIISLIIGGLAGYFIG